MLAVLQRVTASSVSVEGREVAAIGKGLMLLLGVLEGDTEADAEKLLAKTLHLRIFADEAGKMNRSLLDVGGELLVVSQFTLAADVKKGRRPSFDAAARPAEAERLYRHFITQASRSAPVRHGVFGAHMDVRIANDGPVTLMIDSKTL
ncbi:D-aminoacyl-tRNA deacylase [Sulfurimonas diazotrophicus]|uniref:D-aminoacyl-tRNA deacylase n=1 Tax=Sulfurimonas diazotrophicus TaxID=3131939 RepID=A0ABZ3H6K0_9BACT